MNNIWVIFPIILLSSLFVNAYGIGISPDKLEFRQAENKLLLYNPNRFDVNYTIEGCNHGFIEVLRQGRVEKSSQRIILIRYNHKLNADITSCTIDIMFSNSFYSTGFSVDLLFDNYDGKGSAGKGPNTKQSDDLSLISKLFESDALDIDQITNKKPTNMTFIIIASLVFISSLLIILKFF